MEAGRPKARSALGGLRGRRVELRAEGRAGGFAILRLPGRERIGEVRYRLDGKSLVFQELEIAANIRGLGYGSEAVRLLEAHAVKAGLAQRFRADIDARDGLAVYFWLRLGYHPAVAWRREGEQGTISMVRTAGEVRQRYWMPTAARAKPFDRLRANG